MAWQTLRMRLTRERPLLCHNGQLINPLNCWSKRISKAAGKRKKTEADHEELSRLEFFGGLYLNAEGRPIIPGLDLEALLIAGAKKSRNGPKAKAGVIIADDPLIEYDGPTNKEDLFAVMGSEEADQPRQFALTVAVKIGQSKVMRTRPLFREWALEFNVRFEDNIVDEISLLAWFDTAGFEVGLGNWRPRFGLFTAAKAA